MNARNLQDKSFYTMIAEHQKLSERVLRLHQILNQHPCVQHMPTDACSLINEMKNIVMTGEPQPTGIESMHLNFDASALPWTDPELVHDFKVGDIVCVPSRMAQYKFVVNKSQRFEVTELLGPDQLKLQCICGSYEAWKNYNTEIFGHYSHFAKVKGVAA